jgi:type IV secretory pathway TraG/TraD family ATPase VirD4
LSEKGAESDFFSIDDRWGAATVAADYQLGDTPASLFNRHRETLEEKAKKFFGLFREMADLRSVNAKQGIDLAKIVADGGAVYVVGSMRNAKVIRMQRMLLVRIIQLCERRDRTIGKPRPVCAILDEAKYHISKPFLESLGAARDKGLHVILAHQSEADLRDCPADLNAEAVLGAVMENCSLKLVYRVEDPKTAEWLARKSGRIQVDDEVRRVSKNAALSEVVSDERQIRQTERFLIDENMILNLRKSQAVVFGNGLPHFITTSPIPTTKKPENLKTQAFPGDEIIKAAELI